MGGYCKGHVISELYLSQENIERIARLHAETRKNFFSPFEPLRGNSCAKEG